MHEAHAPAGSSDRNATDDLRTVANYTVMKEPYIDGGYVSDIGAISLAGSKPNLFV